MFPTSVFLLRKNIHQATRRGAKIFSFPSRFFVGLRGCLSLVQGVRRRNAKEKRISLRLFVWLRGCFSAGGIPKWETFLPLCLPTSLNRNRRNCSRRG